MPSNTFKVAMAVCGLAVATAIGVTMLDKNDAPTPSAKNTVPIVIPEDTRPLMHITKFINNAREDIGQVTLTQTDAGVSARVQISGLTPGKHGMHFHVKADCGDPAFKNSGGHINPNGHQHGLKNTDGPDNADLPNLDVNADGTVDQTVVTPRVSFYGSHGQPGLFDADGSAMVVHANEDDQVSQPIGGAGARVACAVIAQ